MKDRIKTIMESKHMTQQVFADFIGTTPATLSGIFNDRTRPTINIVESIKKKIPDISTDWLMFGMGDMYLTPQSEENGQGESPDGTQNGGSMGHEPMLNFSSTPTPTPTLNGQHTVFPNGVRSTHQENLREEAKIIDKPQRHVTEIRVYYDDQTWESFVPSKK